MIKVSSYHLFLLAALFFNNANVLYGSSDLSTSRIKIKLIDKGLSSYYKTCGYKNYYNEGIGKFDEYCKENGHDDESIENELKVDNFNDCVLLDFDENFSFTKENINESKRKKIFKILKELCFPEKRNGNISIYQPGSQDKLVLTISCFIRESKCICHMPADLHELIYKYAKYSLPEDALLKGALLKWNEKCGNKKNYDEELKEALEKLKSDFKQNKEIPLLRVLSSDGDLQKLVLFQKLTLYLPVFLEMRYSHFVSSNEILYNNGNKVKKTIENFLEHFKSKVVNKYGKEYVDIFKIMKKALSHSNPFPIWLMELPQPIYRITTSPSKVFGIMADFFDVYKDLRKEYKKDRICIAACLIVESTYNSVWCFDEKRDEEINNKIKNLVKKIIKYREEHNKEYVAGKLKEEQVTKSNLEEIQARLFQSSNDILSEEYKRFLSSLEEDQYLNENGFYKAKNQKNACQKELKDKIKQGIKKLNPKDSRIVIVLDKDLNYVMFKPDIYEIPDTYIIDYNHHMFMADFIRYAENDDTESSDKEITTDDSLGSKLFIIQFDKSIIKGNNFNQVRIYSGLNFTHFHGSGVDNMVKHLFHENASASSAAPLQ